MSFDLDRIGLWVIAFVFVASGVISFLMLMTAVPSNELDELVVQAFKIVYVPGTLGLIAGVGLIIRNRIAYWLAIVMTTLNLMNVGSSSIWALARPETAEGLAVGTLILVAGALLFRRRPAAMQAAQWTLISIGTLSIIGSVAPYPSLPFDADPSALTVGGSTIAWMGTCVYWLWSYRYLRNGATLAQFEPGKV